MRILFRPLNYSLPLSITHYPHLLLYLFIIGSKETADCIHASKKAKTYNSGDSLVVTHLTTNPPVHCLYMAERTGSLIFSVLWSYVKDTIIQTPNIPRPHLAAVVASNPQFYSSRPMELFVRTRRRAWLERTEAATLDCYFNLS